MTAALADLLEPVLLYDVAVIPLATVVIYGESAINPAAACAPA
jgi:hypothetical protein